MKNFYEDLPQKIWRRQVVCQVVCQVPSAPASGALTNTFTRCHTAPLADQFLAKTIQLRVGSGELRCTASCEWRDSAGGSSLAECRLFNSPMRDSTGVHSLFVNDRSIASQNAADSDCLLYSSAMACRARSPISARSAGDSA